VVSSFAVTDTGVNQSPTLSKRELSTTVAVVQSGELIVLGGLDETRGTGANSGLPFLPRWLSSRSGSEQKTEILLVVDVERIGS